MAEESTYWNKFWQKKMTRRRMLMTTGIGAAGLAAAGIVGCGDDGSSSSSTPTGGGTATAAPTAAPATPKTGGTLRLVQGTFTDPNILKDTYFSAFYASIVYDRLVGLSPKPGSDDPSGFDMVPQLASSLPEQPDATTLIYPLRTANFHNGAAVTATDIKASLEAHLQGAQKARLPNLSTVEATDAKTVKLTLSAPSISFLTSSTWCLLGMFPAGYDPATSNPMGTGPMKWVSGTPGESIKLTKNTDYWNKDGGPYIDAWEEVVTGGAPESAEVNLLVGKQVDYDRYLEAESITSLKSSLGDYLNYFAETDDVNFWAWLNPRLEPFKDERVRRAVALATNQQQIIDIAYGGAGTKSGYVSPVKKYALKPEDLTYGGHFDLAQAKALMQEAGYADGFEAQMVQTQSILRPVKVGEVWAQQLAQIGITLVPSQVESSAWFEARDKGNFDVFVDHGTRFEDISGYLEIITNPDSSRQPGIAPPTGSRDLWAKQEAEVFDEAKRKQEITDLQKAIDNWGYLVAMPVAKNNEVCVATFQNYRTTNLFFEGTRWAVDNGWFA